MVEQLALEFSSGHDLRFLGLSFMLRGESAWASLSLFPPPKISKQILKNKTNKQKNKKRGRPKIEPKGPPILGNS